MADRILPQDINPSMPAPAWPQLEYLQALCRSTGELPAGATQGFLRSWWGELVGEAMTICQAQPCISPEALTTEMHRSRELVDELIAYLVHIGRVRLDRDYKTQQRVGTHDEDGRPLLHKPRK